MEFSKPFILLTILKESTKLFYKNAKFILPTTTFSIIIASIFIFLFSYTTQFITDDQMPKYWAFLTLQILILFAYILISIYSRVSVILLSSISYTNNTISFQHLFLITKTTIRKQLITNSYISRRTIPFSLVLGTLSYFMILYPNLTTLLIGIFIGIPGSIYYNYLSVSWIVAIIVTVVEENCYGKKAVERATKLVTGQRFNGCLINLFINKLLLVFVLAYWLIMGDKGFENSTVFGIFVVIVLSLVQIFALAAYTVFYFQCKKHHGEEMDTIGNVQYTKLSSVPVLGNDVP